MSSTNQPSSFPPPPPVDLSRRFCEKCGSRLEEYQFDNGYKVHNGERDIVMLRRCPNRRRIGHWFL